MLLDAEEERELPRYSGTGLLLRVIATGVAPLWLPEPFGRPCPSVHAKFSHVTAEVAAVLYLLWTRRYEQFLTAMWLPMSRDEN